MNLTGPVLEIIAVNIAIEILSLGHYSLTQSVHSSALFAQRHPFDVFSFEI